MPARWPFAPGGEALVGMAGAEASLRRLVIEYIRTHRRTESLENVLMPEIPATLTMIDDQPGVDAASRSPNRVNFTKLAISIVVKLNSRSRLLHQSNFKWLILREEMPSWQI